ncbi:MAG: DUF1805 domain-containing protein [Eubacteriales bacterium]|nr:DUF1805 domain-containing protein [Eubacteriales bacterium]
MVITEMIDIEGKKVQGLAVTEPGGQGHPNMILIQCAKGYLMCGYLNMDAAEKFTDPAVLVGGKDFDEVLANPIKGMTKAAAVLGVKEGMTGREAAAVLSD